MNNENITRMTMDLETLIASFFATMYDGTCIPRDYTPDMVNLFRGLHERAFAQYQFDPEQFKAQAKAQVQGNRQAIHHYCPIDFRFAPASGKGDSLVIHMGSTNGTLTIWTEDPAINERIQSVLNGEGQSQ